MMEDPIRRFVSFPLAVKLMTAVLGIVVIHVTFRLLEKRLPSSLQAEATYGIVYASSSSCLGM